jgi:hypothetical protein
LEYLWETTPLQEPVKMDAFRDEVRGLGSKDQKEMKSFYYISFYVLS